MNGFDSMLINFVQKEINSGKKRIIIPSYLLENASESVLKEIKTLCKINNVEVECEE